MRINHNIVALKTLHNMAKSNKGLDKTMERLSSGLRINHAADDAAGLAITQKMDTQVRGLKQANRNANDGISLIQTAEGALNEVHSMLQRVRELAVQVSNGTYNAEDRKAVQDEVKQLQNEIQRISEHIEFNEKKLLNGDLDRRAFPNDEKVVGIVSTSDTVAPGSYGISVIQEATKAKIEGKEASITGITTSNEGKISLNGEEVEIKAGDTADIVFDKLRGLAETVGANLVAYGADGKATAFKFGDNQHLVFEQKEYGEEYSLDINTSSTELLTGLGLAVGKVNGTDAVATIDPANSDFNSTATVSAEGNQIKVKDNDGFEIIFNVKDGSAIQAESYDEAMGAIKTLTGTDEEKKQAYLAYREAIQLGKGDTAAQVEAEAILTGSGDKISKAIFADNAEAAKAAEDIIPGVTGLGKVINTEIMKIGSDAEDSAIKTKIIAAGAALGTPIKITDEEAKAALAAYKNALFSTTNVNVLDAGPLALQIGANEGQFMEVKIQNLSPEALELDKMNLGTVQGAQKAITTVDNAIGKISSVRSKLGAYQNRLEHTVNNLASASENMTASLSRILDADMAFEMAEYTQKNIISQAGVSMLTQANQRPQQILQLLQG